MSRAWHILQRVIVVALAAISLLMAAHTLACHNENMLAGHDDEGCSATECVCVCACHAALEPSSGLDLCLPELLFVLPSEYVTLLGTSVPADIFRPPLAHS